MEKMVYFNVAEQKLGLQQKEDDRWRKEYWITKPSGRNKGYGIKEAGGGGE